MLSIARDGDIGLSDSRLISHAKWPNVGRAKRVKIKLRLKLSSAGVSHHHDRGT